MEILFAQVLMSPNLDDRLNLFLDGRPHQETIKGYLLELINSGFEYSFKVGALQIYKSGPMSTEKVIPTNWFWPEGKRALLFVFYCRSGQIKAHPNYKLLRDISQKIRKMVNDPVDVYFANSDSFIELEIQFGC